GRFYRTKTAIKDLARYGHSRARLGTNTRTVQSTDRERLEARKGHPVHGSGPWRSQRSSLGSESRTGAALFISAREINFFVPVIPGEVGRARLSIPQRN